MNDPWRLPVVGLAVWLGQFVLLPAPLAARIFLLGPLVIVPRLVAVLPQRAWAGQLTQPRLFVAALPLVLAYGLPAGPVAGALTVPWLSCATIGLAAGARHGLENLPSNLSPERLPDLGIDVALGFWAVGATFATLDRFAFDTGFSQVIVLLTAVHFHFAGLGLLAMSGRLAATRPWLSFSVAGLIVGIPLTALGFVAASELLNAAGALTVGLSGLGVGFALVRSGVGERSDWLLRVAGCALFVGMPMGIAWSLAMLTGRSFLDLDTMVRTHGGLNSLAILLAVLVIRPD
jgi:hypothetical protein